MFKLVCWVILVSVTANPFLPDSPAVRAAELGCRPSNRDSSGFGLVSKVGGGRVSVCGDVLLKVKPAPVTPKVDPAPPLAEPVQPIAHPAPPVVHPKGWVNRWSRILVVRPKTLAARVVATRLVGKRLLSRFANDAAVHYKRGWLLGRAIVVRFTPVSWAWFVDHRRRSGARAMSVTVSAGAVHSAQVAVQYAVDLRASGSQIWQRQPGRIRVPAKPLWFGKSRSWRARTNSSMQTYFVTFDCLQVPVSVGC